MDCLAQQAIHKAQESPDFLDKAAAAEDAYREQTEEAAEAVAEFAEQHDLAPHQRLTWRHRPNVPKVTYHPVKCV